MMSGIMECKFFMFSQKFSYILAKLNGNNFKKIDIKYSKRVRVIMDWLSMKNEITKNMINRLLYDLLKKNLNNNISCYNIMNRTQYTNYRTDLISRKITNNINDTLSPKKRKILLSHFNFKNITEAKKAYNIPHKEKGYEYLRLMYNYTIDVLAKNLDAHYKKISTKRLIKNKLENKLKLQVVDGAYSRKGLWKNFRLPLHIKDKNGSLQHSTGVKDIVFKSVLLSIKQLKQLYYRKNFKMNLSITYIGFTKKDGRKTKNITCNARQFIGTENIITVLEEELEDCIGNMFKEEYEDVYIEEILFIDFNVYLMECMINLGGSYKELPDEIKNKGAIINIKNKDELCFIYSVLCGILPERRNADRVSHYTSYLQNKTLIFKMEDYEKGIEPTSQKILHFEKQNNLCINIYYHKESTTIDENTGKKHKWFEIQPLRISNLTNKKVINLFYYKKHYSYIKNFDRLCNKKGNHTNYNCPRCLARFTQKIRRDEHFKDCKLLNIQQKSKMPNKDNEKMCFTKHTHQNTLPVVIYADFESINEKKNSTSTTSTINHLTEHKPASYRFYIKSTIPLPSLNTLDYAYTGADANIHFVKTLLEIKNNIFQDINETRNQYTHPNKMIITEAQEQEFQNKQTCRFCEVKIPDKEKVRDHDHYTGLFRGASCRNCNLQAGCPSRRTNKDGKKGIPKKLQIPVIFHNLNYDLRLIIKGCEKVAGIENIECIAENQEKFKVLTLCRSFKFIDSMAFLQGSLENLLKNVPNNEKYAMRNITTDDKKFEMICGKGEFPYDWWDSMDKLNGKIPPKDEFYSQLSQTDLSIKQYINMIKTCDAFGINHNEDGAFKKFHDLYLKRDVYGLCDVFENFRKIAMISYGIDPAWYIGLPSFAWDCMLKKVGNEYKKQDEDFYIELLKDENMYMFFEKGIRGGISKAVLRHAQANNPYMKEKYDKTKPTSYLWYGDANNLYGWAMSLLMPRKDFKWITDKEIKSLFKEKCMNYNMKKKTGYTLEVDLEIPQSLHDETNDYPLAPNHKNIQEEELSPYSKECLQKTNTKFMKKNRKLCATLEDKKNYVVHIGILQYYISKGAILKKIHRGIKYTQDDWLKTYIDFNTYKRSHATSEAEKSFYKLMNNAVFGKTMENVRDRKHYTITTNEKQFHKQVRKPNFVRVIQGLGNENCRMVELSTTKVELNKPIFCGQAILDLSKLHMYRFYYDVMKPRYKDNMKLVLTDTDSFVLHITTEDLYKDFVDIKNDHLDTHAYPKNMEIYDLINKKILGMFKDELAIDGILDVMTDVIALRSKVYAFKTMNYEKKTLKGISKTVVKKNISYDDYYRCLTNNEVISKEVISIRSFKLKNYTISQQKRALNPYDDKRYICDDGINSYAYGHYKLN